MRLVIAILLTSFFATTAKSIELQQAARIAAKSTLFLSIDYIDCSSRVAKLGNASGFVITETGLVLTAAHSFFSSDKSCQHEVRGVRGTQVRETGPTLSAPPSIDLDLTESIDLARDMALLRIRSPMPNSLKAHWVCQEKSPVAGEQFFAFGYPEGRPLTPLSLTYSRNDVQSGYWIVSGLTAEGMSGGPVLDAKGNAVGFVQGGLLNEKGHVSAVRYVADLQGLDYLVPQEQLLSNCGEHLVPKMRTLDDGPRGMLVRREDAVVCNLGVVPGFKLFRLKDRKDTAIIAPDPTLLDKAEIRSLDAAQFYVLFSNLTIDQYGLDHPNFEWDRDVLACSAAATRGTSEQEFDKDFLLFTKWADALGKGAANSVEECVKKSKWPTHFTTSKPEATRNISFSVSMNPGFSDEADFHQVIQVPLVFNRGPGLFGGSMVYLDVPLALSQSRRAAEMGGLSAKEGLRHMFDSKAEMQLKGFSARCISYDNISFSSFQNACHAVLGRAVIHAGDRGATCIGSRRY